MAIRQPGTKRVTAPKRPPWQSAYHGARMTPEEYLALPEEKPYLEYVDGMVLQKPMPNKDHAELIAELIYRIKLWIETHDGRIGPEARARLGDLPNFRLPDLSFWRAELPRGEDGPPSLAVEVRSNDQTIAELRRKCEFFRAAGVEACWLIDPTARRAWLYEGGRKHSAVESLTAECLPGFELSLEKLFAVLDA
jgi:Uma2 family endonuclease